ncbi:MAG: efflux RND transporter periplasmic adaptor subunit [Lachnospiraceae bacterium]|nr:efflux RND transporter periplasmic adaptor subunit [Lachnospiraceae bacterium]
MKNRQRKLALLLCAVMSLSALGGCGQKEEIAEEVVEDIAIVEAYEPRIGDLKLSGEFIATVNPDESVYIIPKATAEVMEVKVKAGDRVEAGDVLAILDDTMAQLSMRSAQLNLDNAQRAYTLSYGDGANLLNDMQTDSNLQKVEDGMEAQQERYLDAMDSLTRYQDLLAEAQDELANVRKKYDYREDPEEIKDYADSIDRNTMSGAAEYQAAMARYQTAATLDAQWSAKVDGYKQAIDGCEEALEELQDGMNSTYETFSQTATSSAITNGELREEQKKVSQNSISAAQLAVEQAQEGLDTYVITAAIGGVVENVNVKVHDFATASNPAFVISNKDTMVATYYVSEDVRNTFSIGQQIEIEKDGIMYKGEVIEIGGTIDATTGLFKIKASINGDTSAMLSGTKVKITTATYHEENAIIIPYDAVYYDGTQAYVYTVVDGKAKKTNITTGLYDVEEVVVKDGLSKDDIVITTWSAQLREGVTVSVKVEEEQ